MTIIPYTGQAQWHELRASHIGASEVAALFNVEGCFTTRFELWVTKSGKMQRSFEDSERMFWGRELEEAIGRGAAKSKGWDAQMNKSYYSHDSVPGMGCTPDLIVYSIEKGGYGCLEVKNVDYQSFSKWTDNQPPLMYILQLQHQLACTGFSWGAIAVLVGGNELHVYPYERNEGAIKKLENEVAKFWEEVRTGKEPKALAEDYEIVRDYYALKHNVTLDLSGDNYFPDLCRKALDAAKIRLAAEKEEKAAKAEILQKMAGADFAFCNGFTVSRKEIIKNMAAREAHIQKSERLTIKGTDNE